MSVLLNTAKDPNLIYDVGLHHGQDTDFYLKKGYRVVAFEANPLNAACLEEYGIPHYLKADIVGSETVCLRVLLEFANKPDYISIRSEKLIFRKLESKFDLLERLGYDRFKAVKQEFGDLRPPLPSNNGALFHQFEDGASGPFGDETRGKWKDRAGVLRNYRRVFVKHWLFGDYSYLIQTGTGRRFIAQLERVVMRSIPGWYDTHAVHASVRKDR